MNTLEEVIYTIERILPQNGRQVEATDDLIEDLGFDSIDLTELMMFMEERFNVDIEDAEFIDRDVMTVGDLVKLIRSKGDRHLQK